MKLGKPTIATKWDLLMDYVVDDFEVAEYGLPQSQFHPHTKCIYISQDKAPAHPAGVFYQTPGLEIVEESERLYTVPCIPS